MKGKSTFFLLLAAAILAGGYFLAKKRLPGSDESAEKDKRVLDFKSAQVNEMEIKGADRDFLFERKEGRWMLKRPMQVRASGTEMDGILSSMEFLESRRRLTREQIAEAKLTLADYGLEKPRASVTLRMFAEKRLVTLLIGNEARQGEALYIQVQGRPEVYLVDKYLASRLDKKLDDYRERSLFDFTAEDVRGLEIRNAGKPLEFARSNQIWRVVQPLNARADREKLGDLIHQMASLRAESFLSEDPSAAREYGLEEPAQEVTVKLVKQDAVCTLLLGARLKNDDKKMAARVKGQNSIVSVAAGFGSEVARPLSDLRDHQVASFEPAEVSEIEMRNRGATLTLQRQEGEWKITQPEKLTADRELVEKLLARLGTLQVKEFAADVLTDVEKFGLKPALGRILLKGKGGVTASTNAPSILLDLAIGKTDVAKKLTYAKPSDESCIYGLNAADMADLPHAPNDLRSRVLFQLKKDGVKSCVMKKGKIVEGIERCADGKWKLSVDSRGVLNETAWLKFLNHLEHFEVLKIVGTALNTALKQESLDPPAAILQVTHEVDGKTKTEEILVGRETARKTFHLLWKNELLLCEISSEDQQLLTSDWLFKPPAK